MGELRLTSGCMEKHIVIDFICNLYGFVNDREGHVQSLKLMLHVNLHTLDECSLRINFTDSVLTFSYTHMNLRCKFGVECQVWRRSMNPICSSVMFKFPSATTSVQHPHWSLFALCTWQLASLIHLASILPYLQSPGQRPLAKSSFPSITVMLAAFQSPLSRLRDQIFNRLK